MLNNQLSPILPVAQSNINSGNVLTVDARQLHAALQVQTRFNDWFERRIAEAQLDEGIDYFQVLEQLDVEPTQISVGSTLGQNSANRKDYCFTLDAAKEIAMLERNDIGKQVRKYFIECEKQLRNSMPNFNDPVEAAEAWLKAEKSRRAAEEKARLEAEAHAKTQHALTQKTDALGEILNEWGEGETFRSCIAQAKIFSQWYNIRYITDAGDKFYSSLGRLMTCLCNGGLTSTGKPATKDPRFIGHKFEWKYESHPAAAFGGWNIYHVDAWQYLIDIVKQDGANTIPFIGTFAK